MKNRSSLVADLSFLFMLLLMFVCILFLAGDQDNIWTNCAVLAVATGVVIVTYFTSLVTGLICNLVLIFGYVTFIIVTALYGGGGVPGLSLIHISSPSSARPAGSRSKLSSRAPKRRSKTWGSCAWTWPFLRWS